MRVTLTLDDDVAALLERVRKRRRLTLKVAVNQALRAGLVQLEGKPAARARFETRAVDLGECLLPSLDNISEVLAFAEGEDYE